MDQISAAKSYLDFGHLSKLETAARNKDPDVTEKVAKQFSGIFVQMMLKAMREANAAFGRDDILNSKTVRFYQDMFDSQISNTMTEGKGIGLSNVLMRQLNKFSNINPVEETKIVDVENKIQKMLDKNKHYFPLPNAKFSTMENSAKNTLAPDASATATVEQAVLTEQNYTKQLKAVYQSDVMKTVLNK